MSEGGFDADVVASRRDRGVSAVREALREREAVAFVHAGSDADCAYVGADAVVVTADRAVGLVPEGGATVPAHAHGSEGFTVRTVDDPASAVVDVAREAVSRAAGAADATTSPKAVLTPRAVRHDTALFLERAGVDVTSTTAVTESRAVKTPAEREALRRLGTAVTAGVDAVDERLSPHGVDVVDGSLRLGADHTARDDEGKAGGESVENGASTRPLTPTRLRRTVAVELARNGVDAAETRVRSVGTGAETLVPGRPIMVDCRPLSPDGSRLRAAWTLVVDGDGGWERRADVALRAAHRAGRGRLAGALDGESETAGSVAGAVRAEIAAYGFEDAAVAVHGVGLSGREAPQGGEEIDAGQAVVVTASVSRNGDATASDDRREDVVTRAETLLLDDGVERLVALPTSLSPG